MKQQFLQQPAVKRTLLAVALAVAYGNASALTLSEFTWNPAGAGLAGSLVHGRQHHRLGLRDGDLRGRQHVS
jgi:hypothetical protein